MSLGTQVWSSTTSNGFHHNVYIMFHGTAAKAADSILQTGFRASTGGLLGPGFYCTREPQKAKNYGKVIFKLLVYAGKVKKIDDWNHPSRKKWQNDYSSAWVPVNCKGWKSPDGLTENCLKSAEQVVIAGIIQGWDMLNSTSKQICQQTTQAFDSRADKPALDKLLVRFKLENSGSTNPSSGAPSLAQLANRACTKCNYGMRYRDIHNKSKNDKMNTKCMDCGISYFDKGNMIRNNLI